MEYYFLAIVFVAYILSFWLLEKKSARRMWLSFFLASFVGSAISMPMVYLDKQDIMISASKMGMLYITYILVFFMIIFAAINIWMFRKLIWRVLTKKPIKISD